MALDGIFLHHLRNEIEDGALGSRIDKIHQPSKEEVILTMRSREGSKKLLLSCRPDSARIHFTEFAPENPAKPPMFTMLLRKLLQGARLDGVVQHSLERVLELHFAGTNELGDKTKYVLIIEIMSRYSNIILTDADGKIIDSVRRITGEQSSVRTILPGVSYVAPPPQDKLDIFTASSVEIAQRMQASGLTMAKAAQNAIMGVSPIVCRELENGVTLEELKKYAKDPVPTVVMQDTPKDFSFMPIRQYGDLMKSKTFDTCSKLLDYFYYERVRLARIKSRSSELFKQLTTMQERAVRKAENRRRELVACRDKDKYRMYGDLIMSNLWQLTKGSPYYEVENFYGDGERVRIPANAALTPSANAQKYYKEYRKKQVAEQKLTGFIQEADSEAAYFETVLDALTRAETDSEISAIKNELSDGGYLKRKSRDKNPKALKPLEFVSRDGFRILVGRNNVMNDKLTLKTAAKDDVWLHTKDTPGCHVILQTEGKKVTDGALHDAAVLAAYNSKARSSSNVPVDYTLVKYVKKPSGAKPGKVIYTDYKTEYVTPIAEEIERLNKIG